MDYFSGISNESNPTEGVHLFYLENDQKLLHLGCPSIILLISDQLLNVSHDASVDAHMYVLTPCFLDIVLPTS